MLLLDTCVLLWLAGEQSKLSPKAKTLLADGGDAIFVSAISGFEIGIKSVRKALILPLPPQIWYERALDFHGLSEIPVTGTIAIQATLLPRLHNDPADRILIATAQANRLTLLTPDPLIRAYSHLDAAW